ncbi:AbrB/MazE/SpoVT family DNA-binding domain-containing protein [Janibacter sp. G349]|uniref:AbrB/MazE/SpoVT family DNA-binding domain-containing protein n=1 Tax=Janibacter sp. G349 TaxID=3405424 RepID=UPI003B7AEDD0
MEATLILGQEGSLVIPADVRAALGLVPGDAVHLHVEGRRVVIARQADAVAELRSLGSSFRRGPSLVGELLAERRRAAADGE